MPFTTQPCEPGFAMYFGAVIGYLFLWAVFVAGVCAFMLGRKP